MHDEKENQLYVFALLSRLRVPAEKIPNFEAFMKEMTDGKHSLGVGQIGPLKQRMALLQQIIKELWQLLSGERTGGARQSTGDLKTF